MISRRSLCKRH